MATKPKKRQRVQEVSWAQASRPFAEPWSEESAAKVRQLPGLRIGPYEPTVHGSDPVSVRAALNEEPFGHLITDETIENLCREGRGADLFPYRYPTWRYGIDQITHPCFLLPPTIEELEALEDKVHLALIIRDLDIRGTTPRIRKLIRSTIEPEWSWQGETVQDHLEVGEEE